ncbi:CDP-diacylglycerol--serine O-phosphatidyltransferase [Amycolatopsis cihanbeyliensis]|uniref:CDP-diacylglycerol--serine O-phosphatidyltransferase n=1 Tax=Amycolatopsis cihanbeyliensis TaxID=1128664 RepID=A0A542DIQ7_AMYCI|nr:CDP-diacylglycerol--serine O-phosphatidyltransferase [Amycolatopsis cihanbeyliensis]TQJ02960.1 CDP-diacylglycerol--serine O-phosphatidyltransferase [Amycolatopsis cihanbeyliensis]
MSRTTPGVRLLPNAITVLALCAGLSAVQFALTGDYLLSIGAIGVAAVLDSLDGRIARLLDATSRMGAELDSLSDSISFGVAPALVLYIWHFGGDRVGWIAALIFAVCMILRLARFNTLLDDTEQLPFSSEFFVGVPAPAGGLLVLLPLVLNEEFGDGWWSSEVVVWFWTVGIAGLLISRIPTLSLKTVKAPAKAVAPLLVGVGLLAAAVIQYPLIALAASLVLYLAHIPYSIRRYRWLAKHPEAWDVPARERRAIRRAGSSRMRRLGLRRPLRRRVAGAALRAVRLPRHEEAQPTGTRGPEPVGRAEDRAHRRRSWRRIGLRQRNDRH